MIDIFKLQDVLEMKILRADRQPEHTQLDLEMSFVHQKDVMDLVEGLYINLIKNINEKISIDRFF